MTRLPIPRLPEISFETHRSISSSDHTNLLQPKVLKLTHCSEISFKNNQGCKMLLVNDLTSQQKLGHTEE